MSSSGFTLGDLLGAKTVPCRVRGCTRTWSDLSGSKALPKARPQTDDETAGMCDPCRAKWPTLQDTARKCERAGCEHTWTWTRDEQMDAFVTRRPPPKRLCATCQEQLAGLTVKEIPCTAPGCSRVAKASPQDQLMGTGPLQPPPSKPGGPLVTGVLCSPCFDVATHAKDKPVSCGITGCNRKWTWKADEQLAAFAAGKSIEHAPRRMCEPCRTAFGKLTDREVRCRASGCKKTWTWRREDQLDMAVADKPLPKPPEHLCESCFKLWSGLKDVERPCRQSGCTKTWTDRRGAQLARLLRGKTGDPYPQYCVEHGKLVEQLADREIRCKTDGCTHTWTWTKNQQLAAGVRPPDLPPDAPADRAAERSAEGAGNGRNGQHAPNGGPNGKGEPGQGGDAKNVAGNGSPGGRNGRRRRGQQRDEHGTQPGQQANAGSTENPEAPAAAASDEQAASVSAESQPPEPAEARIERAEQAEAAQMVEAAEGKAASVEAADADAEATGADEEATTAHPGAPVAQAARGEGGKRGRRKRRRREPQAPARHCGRCAKFLAEHKTVEIPCSQCATPIFWPPESQLQTQLGNWAQPSLCGACKRDVTEAARQAAKEALRAGHPGPGGGGEPAANEAVPGQAAGEAAAGEAAVGEEAASAQRTSTGAAPAVEAVPEAPPVEPATPPAPERPAE